jgi:RHS repeat-associated protein
VHTDALGSPVVETNAIGEEITGTRTLYEPYGTPLTTPRDGAPSYTGHPYDTGTGLIYAQQRYYDPLLGVFYSPDPMAVDTTSAFNFNRYAYANNSPYKFTDPDGRESEFLEGFGAGAEASVTGNFRTDEMTSFSRGAGYLMGYGFAQRGQAGPAPPSGPSGMQARIFAASQRPMTASTASSSKVNGNSAASTTPQHRYEIRDRSGDVVKTGISGAPLNQNDSSRRANTQVNRLNRQEGDGAYSATVVETDIPGRTAALQSERAATNRLRAEGNTLRLQQRPQPEN